MRRLCFLLLSLCLTIPLLSACGSPPEELCLIPLDAASTPALTQSERSVRITTPFGPAVTAALPSPEPTETPPPGAEPGNGSPSQQYVLNTNSKRFHLPSCSSVDEMKAANREDYFGTRNELLAQGYKACGRCNP